MVLCPQQPPSHGEGWCWQWCSGRLALPRWHLWECHVTGGFLRQHGKMLLCPGSLALTSGQQVQAHPGFEGNPIGGFQSCRHSQDVPPQHTHHPKHRDLLGSNPARHESHEKQLSWTPWAFSSPTWRRLDPGARCWPGTARALTVTGQCGCSKSWSCLCPGHTL